jgi:hypothetical protein
LTVNGCPPIDTTPLRAAPAFAATVSVTVPLPVPPPLVGEVTAIHATPAVAVHAQEDGVAVIATETAPPSAATDWLLGASENAQLGGAAAWVTVTVWPAMVNEPTRSVPELASTAKATCPLPDPDDAEVI